MREEALLQPDALGFLEILAVHQNDIGLGERRPQFQPALLLIAGELRHRLADPRELLIRGEPVRALGRDALPHLAFQTGDAHHKEFIEVIGRDRQKTHPLQQRMVLVTGLVQDAAVKVQPGQFPVNESLRLRPQACARRGAGSRRNIVAVANRNNFINCCNSLRTICHCNEGLKGRFPNR